MSLEVLAGVLPLKDRFWSLSSRILIKCEVLNRPVIDNFERLVELNFQTRFMTLYFNHKSQNIDPSSYIPNRVSLSNTSDPTAFFDTSMIGETRGIPDHSRVQQIPKIFNNKYQKFWESAARVNDPGFHEFLLSWKCRKTQWDQKY